MSDGAQSVIDNCRRKFPIWRIVRRDATNEHVYLFSLVIRFEYFLLVRVVC